MIVCSRCGKENLDHYKFCLGCGAELTAGAPVQPAMPADTHPPAEAALPQTPIPPEAVAEPQPQICSECGTNAPPAFSFCGQCGSHLHEAAVQPTSQQPAPPPPAHSAEEPLILLTLIRPDGSEGESIVIRDIDIILGRSSGTPLAGDGYLSPKHTRVRIDGTKIIIEDAGSLNGVFVRITDPEPLASGDVFRVGQELLRFDAIGEPAVAHDGTEILGSPNPGYWGRLTLVSGQDDAGCAFPLMGDEMIMGRESGDVLFSDDGYVSGTHAKLSLENGQVYLSDLGSSNGTFLKVRGQRAASFGTFVLMGQQLFRISPP